MFQLINSNIKTKNFDCAYSDNNVIIIDECLDFIIDGSGVQSHINNIKFDISKISNKNTDVLEHIYTDSINIKDGTCSKSVVGEDFSFQEINQTLNRISTNDMFNKFIYPEIKPLDEILITVTINQAHTYKKQYSILSLVRIKTTDCLLKKISKNVVNISVDFDQLGGIDEWIIIDANYVINNKLAIDNLGNKEANISCLSKQSIFFNYSLNWDDIAQKLGNNNINHFVAKFHMVYKLKGTDRIFKLVNISKYTKNYLKGNDTEESFALKEMDSKDELDVKLLDDEGNESSSYVINLKQKEITSVKFLIKRKLGKKSNIKNLVVFQYFKKADIRDFKKFKGLSISLRVANKDLNNPSVIINGNHESEYLPKPMSLTDIDRLSSTQTNSEPMTRVSIPPTPSNNPSMRPYNVTSVIKSQINEKYSQWKQSLRLMPYQCGLILIDDDYELDFEDKDELEVEVRFVGVQRGYYPNLSNIKLFDLNQNKVMDFCKQFAVLCN